MRHQGYDRLDAIGDHSVKEIVAQADKAMWPCEGSHGRCERLNRQKLRSQRQELMENLVLTRDGDCGIQFRNMLAGASQVQREPRQGSAPSPVGEKDAPSN